MARYRFWFHDRDKDGKPINPDILEAAEEIAPTLARYREEEIDCESTSNDILQAAVEAASNATARTASRIRPDTSHQSIGASSTNR